MKGYESDQEQFRMIDEQNRGLDNGVPELLQLKMIQKCWNSFEEDEPLAS